MFFHLLLLVTSSFAREFDSAVRSQNLERIKYINSQQSQWKAGFNFREDITLEELKAMTGAVLDPEEHQFERMTKSKLDTNAEIPDFFDAREQWPNCTTIKHIGSQGICGSCWAMIATATISDRICIHSNGEIDVLLSAQDLLECCTHCSRTESDGCAGGSVNRAWDYWKDSGIVSGGDYKSNEGCKPYSREAYVKGQVNPCSSTCTNSDASSDRYYGEEVYIVPADEESIQVEIMTNGPVQTHIRMFDDLVYYKEGVYESYSINYLGAHTLKIIGWGFESGIPYWLCANSWGKDYGDLGLVKILRAFNVIGIEQHVVGGIPKT